MYVLPFKGQIARLFLFFNQDAFESRGVALPTQNWTYNDLQSAATRLHRGGADQPDMWGIDVVNNSWGNSVRQYDPADPVNVATKAVAARGAVVVFAAGNSGSENGEASVSPFNQAPWTI